MKSTSSKKLVIFNDLETINRLVKDESEVNGQTESAVIEKHLLGSCLPEDADARYVVLNYLYSDGGSVRKTLNVLFDNNSAGTDWNVVHANMIDLVRYAQRQEKESETKLTGEERIIYHCCSQLDSVKGILDKNSANDIAWADRLKEELASNPSKDTIVDIYKLIVDNWNYLGERSVTYRLLADLVALGNNWTETAEDRFELLNIIKKTSAEWN